MNKFFKVFNVVYEVSIALAMLGFFITDMFTDLKETDYLRFIAIMIAYLIVRDKRKEMK